MNVVDLLIVVVLIIYAVVGYRYGFITQLVELIGFLAAFLISLVIYHPLGGIIHDLTHMARSLADLIAFLASWFLLELGIGLLWRRFRHRVPEDLQHAHANKIAGIAPGLLKGLSLAIIILLIIASAPLPAATKQPFVSGAISKGLLSVGTGLQQQFNNLFGSALKDTLAFKTIKTEGGESVALGYTVSDPKVCATDEAKMLDLVNNERRKAGLGSVRQDDQLRDVGRDHSRDMFVRGYFSHVTPDGVDPFQRMDNAGVEYNTAGENLALAPTVDIAMTGLMNSPGHRANILKNDFTRLGIGCMDGGIRGKMFSQEFAG